MIGETHDRGINSQGIHKKISGIDLAAGRPRARLRELGIAGKTRVWFTSEIRGRLPEAYNGGLRGEKGELGEGGFRVPSVLEGPGKAEPLISHIPASTVVLFSTFLELAGFCYQQS